MIWEDAEKLIIELIYIGLDLNPNLNFRNVVAGPDHACATYDYNGALGFRVQIGNNNFIEVPFIMIQTLFEASVANNLVYNNHIFGLHYADQLNGHGCHVHVVGKIFELSGVAEKAGNNYLIHE